MRLLQTVCFDMPLHGLSRLRRGGLHDILRQYTAGWSLRVRAGRFLPTRSGRRDRTTHLATIPGLVDGYGGCRLCSRAAPKHHHLPRLTKQQRGAKTRLWRVLAAGIRCQPRLTLTPHRTRQRPHTTRCPARLLTLRSTGCLRTATAADAAPRCFSRTGTHVRAAGALHGFLHWRFWFGTNEHRLAAASQSVAGVCLRRATWRACHLHLTAGGRWATLRTKQVRLVV